MSPRDVCATAQCGLARKPGSPWCRQCTEDQRARSRLIGHAQQPKPDGVQLTLDAPAPEPTAPPAPVLPPRATMPRARGTDRATSHEAGKRAARGLTAKQRAVLSVFRLYRAMHDETLVGLYRELRAQQLRVGAGPVMPDLSDSSIRTRRSELVTLGLVADTGRKTRTQRGGEATVWDLSPAEQPAPVAAAGAQS